MPGSPGRPGALPRMHFLLPLHRGLVPGEPQEAERLLPCPQVWSPEGTGQGCLGDPTEPRFSVCSTLGLHLDARCMFLQSHHRRASGFGGQHKGPGLLGRSLHPAPPPDKQLPKSAVARLACCAAYVLPPPSTGQGTPRGQGSGLSGHTQAPNLPNYQHLPHPPYVYKTALTTVDSLGPHSHGLRKAGQQLLMCPSHRWEEQRPRVPVPSAGALRGCVQGQD